MCSPVPSGLISRDQTKVLGSRFLCANTPSLLRILKKRSQCCFLRKPPPNTWMMSPPVME